MGDIYCAKCKEPWDYYGIQVNDATTADEGERILRGDGCPSCDWGTACPYCSGTGVHGERHSCKTCGTFTPGRVLARKPLRSARGFRAGVWFTGYSPDTRTLGPDSAVSIIKRERSFMSADGVVEEAWLACPDCAPDPGANPCPRCDGSGTLAAELARTDQGTTVEMIRKLDAARAQCDASDEDPAVILQRLGLL